MPIGSIPNFCGIDLGTTNSTVAIVQNNQPLALPIDPDNSNPRILKSLVYLNPQHRIEVGEKAISAYLWDLNNIPSLPPKIVNTGRLIKTFGPSTGSGAGPPIWVPEIIEVDDSGRGRLLQSLKSVLTSDTFAGTNLFGKYYSLEDLLALLLNQIKNRAENLLNHSLNHVVLGRPVRYVGNIAKEKLALARMKNIARKSGFQTVKFEYEPVGAALAYGLNLLESQKVIVFDFGGGTLDICIVEFPSKKILSVSGRAIGGDLVNSRLVRGKLLKHFGQDVIISAKTNLPRYLVDSISQNWYQVSLLKTVKNIQAMDYFITNADHPAPVINLRDFIINDLGFNFFNTVDLAKIDLSDHLQTLFQFTLPQTQINQPLARIDLENLVRDLVCESEECLKEALTQASLTPTQIDKVILTGGSSKIPIFLSQITQKFGHEKIVHSDPFTTVALGLALRAQEVFGS
ncbi:MAG: Hsp70 family protein [Candidatus Shapirobacteria bacterium]|jgi:hypothetical chaperone protein